MNKSHKKMQTSKRLLLADYIIMGVLLIIFLLFYVLNGIHYREMRDCLVGLEVDISSFQYNPPYDLNVLGTIIGVWIAQLGISSSAYYIMCKSDHKMELPMMLINDMPQDIKDTVDMTQIITSVLNTTNN